MWSEILLVSKIYQPTNSELLVSCLICQITFVSALASLNKKQTQRMPWLLLFLCSLTYYWNTDFFQYMEDFYNGMETTGAKEPLYKLLYNFTEPYYIVWRSIIWGGAVIFYYITAKRLDISPNYAVYVLILLYLPLFVYGRVILAMTIYYYGLSFAMKPVGNNKLVSSILGFTISSVSFFAHRSVLPLIVLFPLLSLPLKRSYFKWLLIIIPFLYFVLQNIFLYFSFGKLALGGFLESFQASAERSASGVFVEERNWKNLTMYWLRNISLYVPIAYLVWNYVRKKILIEEKLSPLLSVSLFVILFSLIIYWGITIFDTTTLSMRYLNMAGIGECLLLSGLCQRNILKKKTLNKLVLLGFLTTEINFIVTYLIHGWEIVK